MIVRIRHVFVPAGLVIAVLAGCGDEVELVGPVSESRFEQGQHLLFEAKTRYEYPNAIELLLKAAEERPDDGAVRVALAYAFTKVGDYPAVVEQGALAARDPGLSRKDALWLAALQARAEDDVNREIAAWKEVVRQLPDDRWGWYELAVAESTAEHLDAASAAAAQALAIESNPARWEASWIYYLHSKALYRAGRYAEAAAAAAAGADNATTWRSTFYRQALAQVKTGKTTADEAMRYYRSISDSEGRNSKSYTEANVALFHFELGDYARAADHARTALELNKGAYQYWSLGFSLIEGGRVEEAKTILETARAEHPDDIFVMAALAWARYRMGDLEGARTLLHDARRQSPRRNLRVEQQLDIVEAAIAEPDLPPAPAIPWLG